MESRVLMTCSMSDIRHVFHQKCGTNIWHFRDVMHRYFLTQHKPIKLKRMLFQILHFEAMNSLTQ